METDWSKVIEVFGSGIIGVFLVMILLQILTQLTTKVIDLIENRNNGQAQEPEAEAKPQAIPVKD